MESVQIPHLAILSGLFGTAASVFGKLISHNDELIEDLPVSESQMELLKWSVKLACIALMVLCNVFVWTFFVRALHQPGGSIVATVTSTATNYCCSAVVGNVIFDEAISGLWWLGTTFVLIGLIFVSLGSDNKCDTEESDDNVEKIMNNEKKFE